MPGRLLTHPVGLVNVESARRIHTSNPHGGSISLWCEGMLWLDQDLAGERGVARNAQGC